MPYAEFTSWGQPSPASTDAPFHIYYPHAREPTMKEETINAVTHGAGAVLGAAGLAVLVALAALRGDAWHVVSCAIYGATLVLLFTSSTLYHSFRGPRVKHVFRVIDHSSIYLLIAGTYTPFLLVSLRGGWGWSLFGVVWGLALAGIAFQVFFVDRFRLAQTLIYLGMGWLVVVATRPLLQRVPWAGCSGCWPAACPIPSAPSSTCGKSCPTTTASGTCSSWPAACAIISPYCFT